MTRPIVTLGNRSSLHSNVVTVRDDECSQGHSLLLRQLAPVRDDADDRAGVGPRAPDQEPLIVGSNVIVQVRRSDSKSHVVFVTQTRHRLRR